MDVRTFAETAMRTFEAAGVAVIVVGFLLSLALAVRTLAMTRSASATYDRIRSVFGRSVLLGLEVLVAADIIRTVALDLTPTNIAVLAGLVLVRTFLSWSLEVELEGAWPWQMRRIRAEERPAEVDT